MPAYELRDFSGSAVATTLSGSIGNGAGDLAMAITANTGWPDAVEGPFIVTIDRGLANEEKVLIASRSGLNLTAAVGGRGHDGTAISSHNSGAVIEHTFSARDAQEANSHIANAALDHHTQYLKTDGTRAPTGITSIAAIAGASAVGDTAAKGTGPTLALSDHRHAREAFGTPVAIGTANGNGAATTVARSNHVHQELARPSVKLAAGGDSLTHNAYVVVSWDSAVWDSALDLWTAGTDVTLKLAGLWSIDAEAQLPTGVVYNYAFLEIRQNGSAEGRGGGLDQFGNGGFSSLSPLLTAHATLLTVDADDVLTLAVRQHNTGASAQTLASARMTATWLGPLG